MSSDWLWDATLFGWPERALELGDGVVVISRPVVAR